MEPFLTLDAVAIPIDQPNLDTDQIIPARFLGKPRDTQVGALFHDLRFDSERKPRPGFVMNQPGFKAAQSSLRSATSRVARRARMPSR